MKRGFSFTDFGIRLMVSVLPLFCFAQGSEALQVENGVSETLAQYRHKVVTAVRYKLDFTIPAEREKPIAATEILSFQLKKDGKALQVDFKDDADRLRSVAVNARNIPIDVQHEHILIAPQYLRNGINTIKINFIAGELSLNRNNEYLYTLLVPDRARTLFPCFDQPDIKARFQLTLTVPHQWSAVGNGLALSSTSNGACRTYSYKESDLFSTYLFSFAAGKFQMAKGKEIRPFNFYFRETDSTKLHLSIDTIFRLHQSALDFLESYTGIRFPFQKLDFVAVPDFQYGGMEHVGTIDYRAASLFLDHGATKDQENGRASLIAHETSHMWFGDLVTMKWFNDVWMKEVFANFMADKITRGGSNYELKFLLGHMPRAYAVDRTEGANPIRQPLNNLQEAGTLYGAIIYDKAPVMMRQLERLMGPVPFRNGLRAYLKQYSFSNATWPDLISILDQLTPVDLQAWNKVWVNTPGRPVISYGIEEASGKIKKFTLEQRGERNQRYVLPQYFEIGLVYPDTVLQVTVNMNRTELAVREMEGRPMPAYVLFNSSGQGYGLFPVDENARPVTSLKDPVMRASAYINLYENMLSGNYLKPLQLMNGLIHMLPDESEELNLGLIAGHITDIYWRLIPASLRKEMAGTVEKSLWQYIAQQKTPNRKKILFRAYQNIALTSDALDTLYAIWRDKRPPGGVSLSEDEYISLALNLTVKDHPDTTILYQQLNRTVDPDRRMRLQFIMPAASRDVELRDRFFDSLKIQKVRKKESWVADALGYLHHPLRTATSEKYLQASLDMLEEIQKTGDIFFPGTWLSTSFGSYTSPAAAAIVRNFLSAHPDYNPRLKAKILQAADPLFRAERLLTR